MRSPRLLAFALVVPAIVASQNPSDTVLTARTTPAELRLRTAAAPYLDAVANYRAGRRESAIRDVLAWPPSDLRGFLDAVHDLAHRLRRCPSQPDDIPVRALEAAALLHVDAALAALGAGERTAFETQAEVAVELFDWQRLHSVRAAPASACSIEEVAPRDFYLAASRVLLGLWEPAQAEVFAVRGLRVERRDPELLLAAATASEAQALGLAQYAHLPGGGEARDGGRRRWEEPYASWQREVQKERGDAEMRLREAITAAPGLLEARLRLGRVLTFSGDFAGAATELERVALHTTDPAERYLARLFLGAVREGQGRMVNAAEEYQRAVQARPEGQAARIALAHARSSAGDRASARVIVLDALGERWPRPRHEDPWWEYPYGRWEEGGRQLAELRLRVMD